MLNNPNDPQRNGIDMHRHLHIRSHRQRRDSKEKLTAFRLIGLVFAVWVSITLPGQPHTLPVGTAKLLGGAVDPPVEQVRRAVAAAALRPLVGTVGAVGVSVAAPHERHALRGVAAEVVGPAGQRGRALELVAAVAAVVVAVARVDGGQALAVGAHELPAGAGFGVWRTGEKSQASEKEFEEGKRGFCSGIHQCVKRPVH